MPDNIRFYKLSEEFGEFSNFALYPIEIDGKKWKTSEHYYQAMKSFDISEQDAIMQAETPKDAANKGRDPNRNLRPDWDEVKNDVMRKAIFAKFSQHEYLKKLLLSTGDKIIIEHSKKDAYWGNGGDDNGKNMLGKILMETRDRLR